ncbi:MAG: hypothetical protein EOP06_05590 [Proteobacteria bacterium]|nr:MAG: hypothetical protein EOP06_05590 [Pseudomonadota bacterium]
MKNNSLNSMLPDAWRGMYQAMQAPFWTHKGIAATCPFCHAEAERGKMRFVVMFENGTTFKSFNCLVCNEFGGGQNGIIKLAKVLGMHLTFAEISAMSGQGAFENKQGQYGSEVDLGHHNPLATAEIAPSIEWPPPWYVFDRPTYALGYDYMISRGIPNPLEVLKKHQLLFSPHVENTKAYGTEIMTFPSLVAPWARTDGEVYGWSARHLGDEGFQGLPKAIAKGGKQWLEKSLFGIREVNTDYPVTITEGLFSSLSTPNSVALGGKAMSREQAKEIARLGAAVYVLALDPGVKESTVMGTVMALKLLMPSSKVLVVPWASFGGRIDRDPNNRGIKEMTHIISETVRLAARS